MNIWKGFEGKVAKMLKIERSRLLTVAALEFGKARRNPHLHVLIGGLGRRRKTAPICEKVSSVWTAMEQADPDVAECRAGPRAVRYIFKEEILPDNSRLSDQDRWPMISNSVWAHLRGHHTRSK